MSQHDAESRLFDEIFHHSAAVKLLVSPSDGRILDANTAATAFYGYSREELQARLISDLNTLPTDRVRAEMDAARREERRCFRFRHRLKDDSIREVEVYSSPVTLNGQTRLLSIVHDVTARNDYEQELGLLRDMVENLPVGIYRSTLDGHGRFLSVNREMVRLTEAESRDALLETPVSSFYENRESREAFINALHSSPDWHSQTLRLRSLQGRVSQFRVSVRKRTGEDGVVYIDGILEDLSQVQAAEQSRQQLLEIIEATPAIIGISRPDGKVIYLNTAGRELLGLGPDNPLDQYDPRQVHTESSFRTMLDEAIPTALKDGHWTGEMNFRDMRGEIVPVQSTLIAHRDEDGELLRMSAVSINVSSQKRRQRLLEKMAYRDPLTGVLNRRGFMQALNGAVAEARKQNTPLAVLMADLDYFKPINDRHGHPVGDEILRKLMPVLRGERRRDDDVGRLGGEEFGLTLPGADRDDAVAIAESIRSRLAEQPITTSVGSIPVTVSIGIATFDDRRESGRTLMRRADQALYDAKNAGRNRVRYRGEGE